MSTAVGKGIDDQDVLSLRRSAIPWVAAPVLAVGWLWLSYELAVSHSGLGSVSFLAPAALMVGGAASLALSERRTRASSWLLLGALTLASAGASHVTFDGPAPYTFALVVSVAALVSGARVGLGLAGPLAAIMWLVARWSQYGPISGRDLAGPLFLLAMVAVVSALASRSLFTALDWHREATDLARERLEQTRLRQAELARALRSLDEVFQVLLRTREEEARSRREAERIRQHTAQFAANVSHELRTPLNLIIGFSELMYSTPQAYGSLAWPEALRADIGEIYRSAEHLSQLVDDILDLSQVEAMRLPIIEEETDLAGLVRDAAEVAGGLLRGKDVQLTLDLTDDLPVMWVDPTRIRQVVLNLLTNACRFTEAGSVHVSAVREGDQVRVAVADTGIGMTAEQMSRVFNEFEQGDVSLRRRHGGTGLGLAISKRFIELHHGRIWVDSAPGHGSTFTFVLPINTDQGAVPAPVVRVPESPYVLRAEQERVRQVVVEGPYSSAIRLLSRYLHRYAFNYANTAQEAQTLIETRLPWAIILTDQDREKLLERSQAIELANPSKAIPVISFVLRPANGRSQALQRVTWLTKPIDRQALLQIIARLTPEAASVLVVDDDPGAVQLLRSMLLAAERPYDVREAFGGQEALAEIERARPDLVLLDLLMPEVGGLDVLEQMGTNPVSRDIPVIMITAGDASTAEHSIDVPHVTSVMAEKPRGMSANEWLAATGALLDALKPDYAWRQENL
jgi:signal transduction histidine kinase/CheY-like chemotaxis protein